MLFRSIWRKTGEERADATYAMNLINKLFLEGGMVEAARKMNIYEAISRSWKRLGRSVKTVNKQQGFKYRGIDAVMKCNQSGAGKESCFIVPEVLEQQRQERTTNKGGCSDLFHLPDKIYLLCRRRVLY